MSDWDEPPYDLDDPKLLYYANQHEPDKDSNPNSDHTNDEDKALDTADTDEEMNEEDTEAQELAEESSSALFSDTFLGPGKYPNLQVTQNIIQPLKIRRTASASVDCFQFVFYSTPFPSNGISSVLTKVFGKQSYKGKQKEIMAAAIQGADILVVAPTGMGKSLCFQVPAVAEQHGVTIVVSPLLALMKDQVAKLRALKVPVYAFTSETSAEEKDAIIKDLASGHPRSRLLYITPEKLCSTETMKLISKCHLNGELNRLVIDEAHCISEWGNDFRQEYRRLGAFRDRFKDVPIMALTASATPVVQEDIQASLKLSHDHLFRVVHPFNRPNLFYEIQYLAPFTSPLDPVAEYILKLHRRRGMPSCGIVYCRTRAGVNEMSEHLKGKGIRAGAYHRGLPKKTLENTLKEWEDEEGRLDVMCATVAFGLGIDKGDVRYVIHADIPKSFEGYYQETGRAGRDNQPAKCVLFYSREDAVKVQRLVRMSKGGETGDSSKPGKQAQESLAALVKFAESTTVCRHVSICRFFGEKIDPSDPAVAKAYCDDFCDICKFPDKVKQRKEALATEEFISTQRQALERNIQDEYDETPMEPPSRLNFPEFQKASDIARYTSSAEENVIIRDSRGNKRPNQPQDSVSTGHGYQIDGKSKRSRIELTAVKPMAKTGLGRAFKIPTFKVPQVPAQVVPPVPPLPSSPPGSLETGWSSRDDLIDLTGSDEKLDAMIDECTFKRAINQPSIEEPSLQASKEAASASVSVSETLAAGVTVANPLGTKKRTVFYPTTGESRKERMQEKPSSDEESGDLRSVAKMLSLGRSCSPDPEEETEVEAPFSNKILLTLRRKSKTRLRKAIRDGLDRGVGSEGSIFVWNQLRLRGKDMSDKARNTLSSIAAKELEFYVLGLSVTTVGYESRVDEQLKGIKMAFGPEAQARTSWTNEEPQDGDVDDEDLVFSREFVDVLKRLASRWRSITV